MSKTQIDRLGDRLKRDTHTESDLRLLSDYRRSFSEAYEAVIQTIRRLGEFPTGRLAKSTLSITEKLRRESIRLSQMQDIAGCRVVVPDVVKQDQIVASIKTVFPSASVIDRRDNPSYGYRAVHIIVEISGKPIEIQVRSSLQHLWAELSEKSADVLDPKIKYGGGPDEWRSILIRSSQIIAEYEEIQKIGSLVSTGLEDLNNVNSKLKADCKEGTKDAQNIRDTLKKVEQIKQNQQEIEKDMANQRNSLEKILSSAISHLDSLDNPKR